MAIDCVPPLGGNFILTDFAVVLYMRAVLWNKFFREEITEIRENRIRSRHCDRLRNFKSHPATAGEGEGVGLKPGVRRRFFSCSFDNGKRPF